MRGTLVGATILVLVAASLVAGYLVATPAGSNSVATSQSRALDNETIFIRVVNSTSGKAVAGEPVTAGPASSATDISFTLDNSYTEYECIHEVPSGAVVQENGNVVSNSTTTTYAPCPLKVYDTNATGWVTISNQNASYFFILAGAGGASGVPSANAQVIAIQGSQTYVTAPIPDGNFTTSSRG